MKLIFKLIATVRMEKWKMNEVEKKVVAQFYQTRPTKKSKRKKKSKLVDMVNGNLL